MNITKLASKDAAEWARAEMFFGEGAGTRRKLLWADIYQKFEHVPEYHEAFLKSYGSQNMAEHAIKAAKERKHIDRMAKAGKNVKGLLRGDRRGLSTGVLVIVAIGYVAHQTGYDEVIIAKSKRQYRKIKVRLAVRKWNREYEKKTQ
jgi:hypothetical protein